MSASKNQIIGGAFQDLEGNPLNNGYLIMQLCGDTQATGIGQVAAGIKVKVPLDSSGNVAGTVDIWTNDTMAPANTCYMVKGYTSLGQLAWGPQYQQVLSSPSPFNLNAWVPQGTGCGDTGNNLLLQVNGVDNVVQSLLNLQQESGIELVDLGNGTVTVTSTGGGVHLPGNDWCVLVEHPVQNFYDSFDFTWNDVDFNSKWGWKNNIGADSTGIAKANWTIGTDPGNGGTYVNELYGNRLINIGSDNVLGDPSATFSVSTIIGNSVSACTQSIFECSNIYMLSNGGYADGIDIFGIGSGFSVSMRNVHNTDSIREVYVMSFGAGIETNGAGLNILKNIYGIGNAFGVSSSGYNAKIEDLYVIGTGAGVSVTGIPTVNSNLTSIQNAYMLGGGAITSDAGATVDGVYFLGPNTVGPSGINNSVEDAFGVGFNDFSSSTGTSSGMYGFGVNALYDCNNCLAIGSIELDGSVYNWNNKVSIGYSNNGSAYPGFIVQNSTVQKTPTGMSIHQIDHARTNGFGTISGTKGQYCTVNITGGAVGQAFLNNTNSLPSGTNITITTTAFYSSAPTTATLANGTATCSGSINLQTVILRDPIPTCDATTEGSIAAIVDSSTNVWGDTITGGGDNHVLGYCDGTNWTVAAK